MKVKQIIEVIKGFAIMQKHLSELVVGTMTSPAPVFFGPIEEDEIKTNFNDLIDTLDYVISADFSIQMNALDAAISKTFDHVDYWFHKDAGDPLIKKHPSGLDILCIEIMLGSPEANIVVHMFPRGARYFEICIGTEEFFQIPYSEIGPYTHRTSDVTDWNVIVDEWKRIYDSINKSTQTETPVTKNQYGVSCLTNGYAADYIVIKASNFDEAYDILWNNIINEPEMNYGAFLEACSDKTAFKVFSSSATHRRYKSAWSEITFELIDNNNDYVYIGGYEK